MCNWFFYKKGRRIKNAAQSERHFYLNLFRTNYCKIDEKIYYANQLNCN